MSFTVHDSIALYLAHVLRIDEVKIGGELAFVSGKGSPVADGRSVRVCVGLDIVSAEEL